jgi:hypothetical protein
MNQGPFQPKWPNYLQLYILDLMVQISIELNKKVSQSQTLALPLISLLRTAAYLPRPSHSNS